ncbi:coiled-coil domain-containing protein 160 [Lissotriton helveticus]
MAREEHWVERLFSPQFTVDDFFEPPGEDTMTFQKRSKERAKKVERIYNLATKKIQEKEKRKRKEYISKMIVDECEPKLYEKNPDSKTMTTVSKSTSLYSGDSNFGSGTEDYEDICIWKSKDLATLRQEMRKKHYESKTQNIQLVNLNSEIVVLKNKLKKTEEAYENVQRAITLSKRKSQCYALHVQQLEKDNFKKDLELQAVKEELREKSKDVSNLSRDLHKAKIEIQSLVLQNKDLQKQSIQLKQQHEIQNVAFIEKEKLQYSLHLKKLHQEMQTIREEMNSEKLLHARNLSALELLRKHFSSLPTSKASNTCKVHFLQE